MKKKISRSGQERSADGRVHAGSNAEFYSASPVEKPLYDNSRTSVSHQVRRTNRHKSATGSRPETMDPREKMALMAILKSTILILLLLIAFFLLWKGISIYEETVFLEQTGKIEKPPVLQAASLAGDFDIQDLNAREKFAERVSGWKEANRLVRSADALLQRNNYDQAIEQCQDALRKDPAHAGALDRLGQLHYAKGNYAEAINAYIHLLSVDPSRQDVQKRLIQSLDAFGDHRSVKFVAEWYLEENFSDADIQRYLANALYADGDYAAAAEAYGRVLRDDPKDIQSQERQALTYMQIGQYETALPLLLKLRENNSRHPDYYRQIAICQAQLKQSENVVETLGRSALLFGETIVLGWVQDPALDPVREDRTFQAFTERIGGEEFRLWLENLARNINAERTDPQPGLKLEMPDSRFIKDNDLLKPRPYSPDSR